MGYDAFVVCNCYQNKLTVPPPHEEYVKFDEDGLNLDIPSKLYDEDNERAHQMYVAFDDWQNKACNH